MGEWTQMDGSESMSVLSKDFRLGSVLDRFKRREGNGPPADVVH